MVVVKNEWRNSAMNSSNVRSFSMASLAVSVSAAALLGVSGVASADDPWYCNEQAPCRTNPADDYYSFWGWDGQCAYGEGGCACVAEGHGVDPWSNPPQIFSYMVYSNVPECYGE